MLEDQTPQKISSWVADLLLYYSGPRSDVGKSKQENESWKSRGASLGT